MRIEKRKRLAADLHRKAQMNPERLAISDWRLAKAKTCTLREGKRAKGVGSKVDLTQNPQIREFAY
jgi:hypothetical protein